jgi:hypothetical protein
VTVVLLDPVTAAASWTAPPAATLALLGDTVTAAGAGLEGEAGVGGPDSPPQANAIAAIDPMTHAFRYVTMTPTDPTEINRFAVCPVFKGHEARTTLRGGENRDRCSAR